MKLVILESPYSGATEADIERNHIYLQRCIQDSIDRGESPYASHQMLTQALDDASPSDRAIGIAAGYAWWRCADAIVFYVDLGWSSGMVAALTRAIGLFKIELNSALRSAKVRTSATHTLILERAMALSP